jgi:aminopeptidase N
MKSAALVRSLLWAPLILLIAAPLSGQDPPPPRPDSARLPIRVEYVPKGSRADTLRGSFTTPGRIWWDVTFYDLRVAIDPADSSIAGYNGITYRVLEPGRELQIDLMEPLVVDRMMQNGRAVRFRREGNAYFAQLPTQRAGEQQTITVYYHGRPQIAQNPPWQGGFTWTKDSLGRPWVVTTDQGMGASVWWPNKDTQADEPDSQRVALTLPDPMIDVSNGRLRGMTRNPDGTTTYEWFVVNPINNYAIAVAGGSYAHYSEVYEGLEGPLTLDFWPLDYNLEKARRQWTQARSTLQCFEHWFGPYPWYEDGYKLLEVPNAGMEHQSAVAYGNWYENGYRRRDSSGTGLGLEWDFIIVHESAHEWFGNNITAKDNADMWVHESFANYAEGLYTECLFGKDAGARYIIGNRRGIRNDRPIIPAYDVNEQGSGDMYPKGGEMLHTIRQIVGDDDRWRDILRGLNRTYRHQTVMGKQIEEYVSGQAGTDLGKVFDQYLRTTMIPTFEYAIVGDTLHYRWTTVVPDFDMPLPVTVNWPDLTVIQPSESWQRINVKLPNASDFRVDENYYVIPKEVERPRSPEGGRPAEHASR